MYFLPIELSKLTLKIDANTPLLMSFEGIFVYMFWSVLESWILPLFLWTNLVKWTK